MLGEPAQVAAQGAKPLETTTYCNCIFKIMITTIITHWVEKTKKQETYRDRKQRQETRNRRQETRDRRQETGDKRQETGDKRQETGDRRRVPDRDEEYLKDLLGQLPGERLAKIVKAAEI